MYPPRLQPHLGLQRVVDLVLDAEVLIERSGFRVELDAAHQRWLEPLREANDALVFLLGVHPDLREVGIHLVAQHALHQVEVVINQRRRFAVLGAVLDLGPQVLEEANVGAKLVFLDVGRRRAHDKTAQPVLALAGDDALQPLALFFGVDLARHAHVIDGRHVHQEPSRKRNVTGDARSLLGDGFLGDLNQDLLTFLQQVGNERHGAVRMHADVVTSASASARSTTVVTGALGLTLLVGGRWRRGTQFRATVGFLVSRLILLVLLTGQQPGLAAFFGGNHLVFVHIGDFGNPPFGEIVAAVERLLFQLELHVAGNLIQRLNVLRHGMELHLVVFQSFVFESASFGRFRWCAVLNESASRRRLRGSLPLLLRFGRQLRSSRDPTLPLDRSSGVAR